MSTHIDGGCGRIGRRMGLFCAFLGVMTAYLMIQVMGGGGGGVWHGVTVFHVLMLALYLSPLFITAAFFGTRAGRFLCHKGNRLNLNIWIGIALALGSVTAEVLACTFVYIVMRGGDALVGGELFYAWFAPLAIIMMFGGLPAVGLGVLYGILVRSRLDKLGPHDDATSFHY